jgi:SAM-dependent methyltransferase
VSVGLVRANLESLPLPDASFDLVLCTQVIEHLLDPALGLRELARVLAPGGRLVITTDNERNTVTKALNLPRTAAVRALRLRGRRAQVVFPHASFTATAFERLVRDAGLEPVLRETFRFSLQSPLDRPPLVRALNALERRSGAGGRGDILAIVARKPG